MISQIVLLRHATRSAVLEFGASESSLNAVGLAQAEDLADLVKKGAKIPPPTQLISSPKLRARQTLTPLSKSTGLKIEILDDLDERRDHESANAFDQRIRSIPEKFSKFLGPEGTLYLCTHLDVLEAAALLWPTNFSDRESTQSWSTLEYQVFKFQNGILESAQRGRIEPRL